MVRKLVRQMLTAQILSALTVSLCLLIDSIMIGQFLGEDAVAAYGLANPMLLAIGAIGSLLAAGIQVACSRSLGRGSQEETNAGFSSAVAVSAVISIAFMALVLLFSAPLARVMGAGKSDRLFEQTRDYLTGFCIGAPGSMGALVLIPFLQMAGQSGLLIVAVIGMTVSDIALDILNVTVFHGGMFGMGLASSLSYYVAMAVAAFYFLSGRCVFRFSMRGVTFRKILELLRGGLPAGVGMAASVLLIFALNRFARNWGGSGAIAALTVITTIGNAANCITTGVGGVSLTLAGIFAGEEDRTSLRELMGLLFRCSVPLGLCMGAALAVFAPAIVSLFIPAAGATQTMATLGVRLFALGLIPSCVNAAMKNMYQATDRALLTEGISVVEGAVLPVLAALAGHAALGLNGLWLYFALGEWLTVVCIGAYIRLRAGRWPWQDGAYLLLRPDFGVSADRLLEERMGSMEEVIAFAHRAEAFCAGLGQSARVSHHIGLCIEEMAGNIVQHGFTADKKAHHLSVRLMSKPEAWILRFRDDCGAFDPVSYVPKGDGDALGIRLALAIADEASYTYSLNLNNLMLKLPADLELKE